MIQLQLTITEPCHEDWDKMTPDEHGRFCNSCAKSVVDFSALTDAQLLDYFAQLKGKDVCGRTHADQLQRTIHSLPAPQKKIFRYWQYAAASFLMLLKGPQVNAQTGLVSTTSKVAKTEKKLLRGKDLSMQLPERLAVTDLDGLPIPGASIQLLSDASILITDSSGIIRIGKLSGNETLKVSAIGYEEKMIVLKEIESGTIKLQHHIQLLENIVVNTLTTTGQLRHVVAGGMGYRIVQTQSLIKDTIARLAAFIEPSIKAYPNPVMSGNNINITLKTKTAGTYRFYIYDASGKLMLAQSYKLPEKTCVQQLFIPSTWSAGIYFVNVADEAGKNTGKTKIVIQ